MDARIAAINLFQFDLDKFVYGTVMKRRLRSRCLPFEWKVGDAPAVRRR